MTHPLRSLIDAPLANATKVNAPGGKRPATRSKAPDYGDDLGCPKASAKELRERRSRAASEKLTKLYDYYATTDLSFEKIAQHMGVYWQEQTGVDDKGKPVFARVLDVKTVEAQIAWRRSAQHIPSGSGGE